MAGYNPYATNLYQGTQMFPQLQGNVYTLNNSMEIALFVFIPNLQFQLFCNKSHLYIFQFQQHRLHLQ